MQLGDLDSFIAQARAAASQFVNKTEGYIIGQLSSFRDKRGQLNFQISKLQKNAPLPTAPAVLKNQYAAAMDEALSAKQKADWLGSIADQFTAVTGLGILPAAIAGLPVAAMIAGIVIIGGVIYNATNKIAQYIGGAQAVDAAKAAGRDPVAALANYNANAAKGGLFGDAAALVWPVALAGVAYLLITNKRR